VARHFEAEEQLPDFIEFIVLNSHYPGLLRVYVFIATMFNDNPPLQEQIDADGNWNIFFRVMESNLKNEQDLWAQVGQALHPK
jgi:hypothetical protein